MKRQIDDLHLHEMELMGETDMLNSMSVVNGKGNKAKPGYASSASEARRPSNRKFSMFGGIGGFASIHKSAPEM